MAKNHQVAHSLLSCKSLLVLFLVLGTVANLRAQPLPVPRTNPVFVSQNVPATASRLLVGGGITLGGGLSSKPSIDTAGNEIVWRESWSATDERGGRHVSYRQHLINRHGEAEIFGSGVGLHYSATGRLWSLGGRQFESAKPSNVPVFSAEEAIDRVVLRLETHPGFEPEALSDITAEMRAGRAKRTELKLVQIRDLFRYAYFTFAMTLAALLMTL